MSKIIKNKVILVTLIVAMALLSSISFCALNWSYLIDCTLGFEDIKIGILQKDGFSCYGTTDVEFPHYAGITVYLKVLDEEGDWVTVTAWEDQGYIIASVDEEYAVGSGTYRLETTHKAFDSSDLDTPVEMHYIESDPITIY